MVCDPSNLQPTDPSAQGGREAASPRGRLNLLLSYAGWRAQNWSEQLPRLLEPMGVYSFRVDSGEEATEVIRRERVHIAVVDLGLPLTITTRGNINAPGAATGVGVTSGFSMPTPAAPSFPTSSVNSEEAGTRLLQLMRRLESPPHTVVVRRPVDRTAANQRTLNEALREGAFAVLDAPVDLELILEVIRRILRRHYADTWPGTPHTS